MARVEGSVACDRAGDDDFIRSLHLYIHQFEWLGCEHIGSIECSADIWSWIFASESSRSSTNAADLLEAAVELGGSDMMIMLAFPFRPAANADVLTCDMLGSIRREEHGQVTNLGRIDPAAHRYEV